MTGRSKGGYRPGDSDLWDRVAKTVIHRNPRRGDHIDRMDFDDPGPSNTDQKAEKSKNIEPASIIAATPPRRNSKPRVLPDLVHGKQPSFDKRTETKLKRGLMPIEGRLDLHGMTQNQARSALGDFITHAYHARKRCVLVITGKGLGRSDGSAGILRSMTPRWLNESGIREKIVGFRHAACRHGGEGALYVLLKRGRRGSQVSS